MQTKPRGPFLEKELLIEIAAKFGFSKRNKDYLCIIECSYNYYDTVFSQAGGTSGTSVFDIMMLVC